MILTIDIEPDWEIRGTKNLVFLPRIFDLLEDYSCKATLFVVSSMAEDVKEMGVPKSMEVASHSKTHVRLDKLSTERLKKEIFESKKELEEVFKRKVFGFRAPYFVMPTKAYEVLANAGYVYSSSKAFGFFPSRYFNLSTRPRKISGVLEFPVSRFLFFNFGLSWIRLFWPISRFLLPKRAGVFYFHPTEFLEEAPPKKLGLIGRVYGINRGRKAWEIFEEIIVRYAPTQSFNEILTEAIRKNRKARKSGGIILGSKGTPRR